MRRLAASACLVLLAAAAPALAQQQPDPLSSKDRSYELYPSETRPEEDASKIMSLALPLLDNQTLRYYDGKGDFIGLARRHGLTISFYDAEGNPLGRAQRVSQRLTRYYDAQGNYLGRRVNQHLVTATRSTTFDRGWSDGGGTDNSTP